MGLSVSSGRVIGCKDSIGGIKNLYLFKYVKYARSLMPVTGVTLTSFPATEIYPFEFTNQPTLQNNQDENEGGKFFTESLSLEFTGIYVYDDFKEFLKYDLRAIIEDYNGKYRMLGAFNGLEVERLKVTTGESKNSFRGWQFELKGIEENQSLFLNDLNNFTIIPNDFLLREDGEYLLTEDFELIRLE